MSKRPSLFEWNDHYKRKMSPTGPKKKGSAQSRGIKGSASTGSDGPARAKLHPKGGGSMSVGDRVH